MGLCESIETIERNEETSNYIFRGRGRRTVISTYIFRGRGRRTVISTYHVPVTNQRVDEKTFIIISNGQVEKVTKNIDEFIDAASHKENKNVPHPTYAAIGRRSAENMK